MKNYHDLPQDTSKTQASINKISEDGQNLFHNRDFNFNSDFKKELEDPKNKISYGNNN
jgi:hypothetical protein